MKKISVLLLVFALLLCFNGCQPNTLNNSSDGKTDPISTTSQPDSQKYEPKESLAEKLVREIDGAYEKEQNEPENCSTVGMIELADKYANEWKLIADEYYNKIMEYDGIIQPNEDYYSSDDLHTFVSNMKNNREQYHQVQCENYVKTLQTIYGRGTIVGPVFADYKYNMQKEWALELVYICQHIGIE